jgi:UDP:flavonoid glycosyltransferase YjiC (YdhE family)
MASILFVTWEGGGNLPPALGIASELQHRGDGVRFLGHPQQRTAIEGAGFRFEPYTHARPWSATAPLAGLKAAAAFFTLFTDRGPGQDLLAAVAREPADVIVIDCMVLGALQAAEGAGLRSVVLAHTFYEFLTHRWSRGPIGLVARLKGQRPRTLWSSAHAVIVTALATLDPATRRTLPSSVRHVGPIWPANAPPPAPAVPGDPMVLVSLSTIHYPGQAAVLQAIVDALGELPVRAIVTTGRAVDPASLRASAHVEVHRLLPHAEVMPKASLLIGHGGHGTTMYALAHDLPMVIMPMHPMLDQPMIARVLQAEGVARVLARSASPVQIRAAIRDMLADGPHRAAAARLGAKLRGTDGAQVAADLIQHCIARP